MPHREQIKVLEQPCVTRSILLYLKTYAAVLLAIYLGLFFNNAFIAVLVIFFIAGRQHSLYILNHDASHYSLFPNKKMNKLVATLFSNLVMFHHPEAWSFIQWRRVHLKHHSHLFTEQDPNYAGRKRVGDTEYRYSLRQLLGKCLLAIPQTFKLLLIGKQDLVMNKGNLYQRASIYHFAALFTSYSDDREMEVERCLKLGFFILALIMIHFFNLWYPFLVYWMVPMYTVYPMILKFHDLTEHYWESKSNCLYENTQSVSRSFWKKVIISFLPRGYHREHHMYPRVPVVYLPKVHKLINEV